MKELRNFVKKLFDVDLKIFLEALKINPNAQGYILGAISEQLLRKELVKKGYQLVRIREKWEGDKHPNHHGDFYIRKEGKNNPWYVLESKGIKSNTEDWWRVEEVADYSEEKIKRWFTRSKIRKAWWNKQPSIIRKAVIKKENFKKIKILATHFVSGKSKKGKREIATPRRDEFNIIALDLFLRTGKHEFIFANPKNLEPSKNYPHHLQQNYLIDILAPGIKERPTISPPWSYDFSKVFRTLLNPIKPSDMQIDARSEKPLDTNTDV